MAITPLNKNGRNSKTDNDQMSYLKQSLMKFHICQFSWYRCVLRFKRTISCLDFRVHYYHVIFYTSVKTISEIWIINFKPGYQKNQYEKQKKCVINTEDVNIT